MLKHADIIEKLTRRQKAELLTGKDFWSTVAHEDLGLPTAYLSDGPHGMRRQADKSDHLGLNASIPATCFPTAATMANTWNEELGYELGKRLGMEAAAQNVNMVLGPGLNIKRSPLCGRNFEYFSEDPHLAGKMAASYVRGIQNSGVAACVKHFAANNQELRRMVSDSVIDERTLREIYLTGFEIAVEEGQPMSLMSSYNKINGEFANENIHVLKEILRDEWGFKGVVVTDWAGCNDRVQGLIAGNELEMPSCRYGADDVFNAMEEGRLDETLVDERLDNLIDLILKTDAAVKSAPKEWDIEEHHAFAEKCAEESIVLLKNDGALPVAVEEKVCVVGDFAKNPRYQGAGSSVVNPTKLDNFFDCMTKAERNFSYAQGFNRYGKKKKGLLKKAVSAAKSADKIIFFAGLDEVTEAEGLDRSGMKLPQNQLDVLRELYKLDKPVTVVLSCGSAVERDVINDANAVLHAYLGGQAGAKAVMNVLYGEVNPAGRLAESYPVKYEDTPSAPYFPGTENTVEYRESVFVGYRYYATAGVKTAYPFGYGLSYTTFEYGDLKVNDKGVSFVITNTGDRDGAEVAQLYIGKKQSDAYRPLRELKGFKKVFVKAGESVAVEIPFDKRTFRIFNQNADEWQVESGDYTVEIGASSEDIRLAATHSVDGDATDFGYDREALKDYFACNLAAIDDKQFETVLGREIPDGGYKFYKKKRMVIHENCTVGDLRYSRRWVGRFFSGAIRFAIRFMRGIGQRTTANTLVMGMLHQPVRGLAKFGGMTRRKMEGMILMFNGHFFKGLGQLITKGKDEKAKAKKSDKRDKSEKTDKE